MIETSILINTSFYPNLHRFKRGFLMKNSNDKEKYYFIDDTEYESFNKRSRISHKKRLEKRIKIFSALFIGGFVAFIAVYNILFPYLSSAAGDDYKPPNNNMATDVYNDETKEDIVWFDTEESQKGESSKYKTNKKMVAKNYDSIKVLVNKQIFLPDGYEPKDLVIPNVAFSFSGNHEKKLLREEAARALEALFEASIQEGLRLVAVSGYRSYERQYTIFTSNVRKNGLENTLNVSAMPGSSEHQTGLSMDVSTRAVSYLLRESFGQTPEGIWLAENAHKYGYIIRYPLGKERVTGYSYEPWHIRYVGKELATHLYENGLTLEEYYEFEIDPFYYNGITYENIEKFGIDPRDIKKKSPNGNPGKDSTVVEPSPTPEVSPTPLEGQEGEEVPTSGGSQLPSQEPTTSPTSGTTSPTSGPTATPSPTSKPTAPPTSKPTVTPPATQQAKPTTTPSPTPTKVPSPTTTVTPTPTPTTPPTQAPTTTPSPTPPTTVEEETGNGGIDQGSQGSQESEEGSSKGDLGN